MRNRKPLFQLSAVLVLSFLIHLTAPEASSQVQSTFDSSLEGWMVTGDNSAAWEPTTGNPDGCLSVNDHATGAHNYLVAPPDYLGDWSAFHASVTLSYDVYLDNTSGGGPAQGQWMMRISGPGGSAGAIDVTLNYPPQATWATYQVTLDPLDWTLESGTWAGLLSSVTSVLLDGEFVDGEEIVRIDNVILSQSPVPVYVPCEFEDFNDAGTGDWSFEGTAGVSNPENWGNGGGYARVSDQGGPNSYALAPARFRGDWSTLEGNGKVTIDLRILSSGGTNNGAPEFIRLSGPGGSAYVSLDPADLPVSNRVWKTFEYPIEAAAWTVDAGTWAGLLANITEIRIDLEYFDVLETVGFDNFGRLESGCPAIDEPVEVHDPTISACGWYSLVGVNGVALNPLDGELYGVIPETSPGGGLYSVTGPGAGIRLQAYNRPSHLIFDTDGDAYITENYDGEVHRLEWGGASSLWVSGFHSGDDDPYGMTFAPPGFNGPNVSEGDILVTDHGSNGADEIWAFSPDTAEGELLVMPDQGDTDHVDIAATQTGYVLVCDALDPNNLFWLNPDGSLGALPVSSMNAEIVSVVYDDVDAMIYAADAATDALCRIEPWGAYIDQVAEGFSDLGWGCLEIDVENRILWVSDYGGNRVYCFTLPGWTPDTVDAEYTCIPAAGTVPFPTTMTVTLNNLYSGLTRRMAARINAQLGGGTSVSNWKSGFTNIAGGGSYVSSWSQSIPALGSVIGDNVFVIEAEDVTPAPYNQPPYPASGDTDTHACTVTAVAP